MPVIPVITSNGQALAAELRILSIEVEREVNRVPVARLVLADGDLAQATFAALDGPAFALGAELHIKVRQDEVTTDLFKGLVVRLRLEVTSGAPTLLVEVKDKAFRLTRPRRSLVYADVSDADAIGTILGRGDVSPGVMPEGGPIHPALVQYDASDWDFIALRAEANGLAVVVKDGTLSLSPPDLSAEPVLTLSLDGVSEIELELDASDQLAAVEAVGWNLADGVLTDPAAAEPLALKQGNIDPTSVADALGLTEVRLMHMTPIAEPELKAWASARSARNRLSMIRGRIAFAGSGLVEPLTLVALEGMGDRFNGKALVTGVRHLVEAGGWRTDVRLGFPPESFARRPDVLNTEANGLLPAARGLRIGMIQDFREDPEGEHRVSVALPGVDGAAEGVLWARLASPEAGDQRGVVFRPDAGDEVVVGFLGDDPRQPVVLGSLFGSRNAPPTQPSEENLHKGLHTRSGAALTFVDQDKPIIVLKTPGASIRIDDDAGETSLTDAHGNSLVLSADGVVFTSVGDFAIEASGAVTIKGASVEAN